MDNLEVVLIAGFIIFVIFAIGLIALAAKWYVKVEQGTALVRNGAKGSKVSFSGIIVVPILHKCEFMDISVKRVEIVRQGKDGLICKDNMRADVNVAFFVRVNKAQEDVLKVAQSIGCRRASEQKALEVLFDAKFSEALKTVGKRFDFVELYNERDLFKEQILKIIGTDLNGYVLDDCAIDYLEQTPLSLLNKDNILDAEGIKKITDLTAKQITLSNHIEREKEKTIKKQDVEAREAILQLEKQQAEAEEKQKKEIVTIRAREEAEATKVQEEERFKIEQARIKTDEEILVLEENKQRQVIVAQKNKERTQAVETERVEKDRLLEVTERERIVTLANIEKEKVVEVEKKNIQDVIKERVMVERTVVEEEERIKDTKEFATAERAKQVAIVAAEKDAQEELVKSIKAAEAKKKANELRADEEHYVRLIQAKALREAADLESEKTIIDAEARKEAARKESEAKKILAEGIIAEQSANGFAEAKVTEAKATAQEKQGMIEANVLEAKYTAESKGIENKAEAMKKLDGVGKDHEEFKLRLEKDKEIELAKISADERIAAEQATVFKEGLRSAKIDIVGGESMFFDKLVHSITRGKSVDRMVYGSKVLTDVKDTFFNGDPEYFKSQLKNFVDQFGMSTADLKNLSLSALITKLMNKVDDSQSKGILEGIMDFVETKGLGGVNANIIND